MKHIALLAFLIIYVSGCNFRSKKDISYQSSIGIPDSVILGNWYQCNEGYYYEEYFTDSFIISKIWYDTDYFLADDQAFSPITRINRYQIRGDSIFAYNFYLLKWVAKIKIITANEINLRLTEINPDDLYWSGVPENKDFILTRLSDTISFPPMKFEQDYQAWYEWWDKKAISGFRSRARLQNCIKIYPKEILDSLESESHNYIKLIPKSKNNN